MPMRDELLNESYSSISSRLARSSASGLPTTTRRDRIRRSATRPRQLMPTKSPQPPIALRYLTGPRAGRLLAPRCKAYQLPRL